MLQRLISDIMLYDSEMFSKETGILRKLCQSSAIMRRLYGWYRHTFYSLFGNFRLYGNVVLPRNGGVLEGTAFSRAFITTNVFRPLYRW